MKASLFLLILFFPCLAFGQFASSLDFVGGIDYTYRSLKTNSQEDIINEIIAWRAGETGKLNWHLGLNYNKRLTRKFYLKTGVQFTSVGYRGRKVEGLIYASDFNNYPGSGIVPSEEALPREIQFIHDYLFIELPVRLRYEFSEKKISPFVEAGISPCFFITSKTKTITDIGTNTSYSRTISFNSMNQVQLVGNVAFGLQYQLKPQLKLYGMPSFRYHFTKLVNAPIAEYLYGFGLEFGLRRGL